MSPRARTIAWQVSLVIGAAALVAFLVRAVLAWPAAPLLSALVVIVPLYLVAHAVRALRLYVLLYDSRHRLRSIAAAHFYAAGVSILIPWKLGEIYRMAVINRVISDAPRAIMAVWIERFYDILALVLIFCALAAAAPIGGWTMLAGFFLMALAFLFASFFLFLVLPENLNQLKRHLILKHNSQRTLLVLRACDRLHGLLLAASALWRRRWATVSWLSLAIWSIEMTILGLLVDRLAPASLFVDDCMRILFAITVRPHVWQPGLARETGAVTSAQAEMIAVHGQGALAALAVAALFALWGLTSRRRAVRTATLKPATA